MVGAVSLSFRYAILASGRSPNASGACIRHAGFRAPRLQALQGAPGPRIFFAYGLIWTQTIFTKGVGLSPFPPAGAARGPALLSALSAVCRLFVGFLSGFAVCFLLSCSCWWALWAASLFGAFA